jgi:lipoyl-dependent peroxiredoxin
MQRKATASWRGGLKGGQGSISTSSGVLSKTPYSFAQRFENASGTNPEELIAAAHSGCFSMALAAKLEDAGMPAQSIETTATVTLDRKDGSWTITESHLDVTCRIPSADRAKFEDLAGQAKENCPVSRLLRCDISMNASLAETA